MPNQSDIKTIITLTKEQFYLLKTLAIVLTDSGNTTYYHLPQWFKDLGNGEFEVFTFEQLPDYIKEDLKDVI